MKRVIYHVFTDRRDYYTEEYRLARKVFNHWARAMGCVRLYEIVFANEENYETEAEDCLMAQGPYPI